MTQTSTLTKAAAWVGLLLSIVCAVLLLVGHGSVSNGASAVAGSINAAVVQNSPEAFLTGIYLGNQKIRQVADTITIGPGLNQATWKNTSGSPANVYDLDSYLLSGIASSTMYLSVGTTTCSSVTDTFNSTAPMWSQLIDAFKVATSSQGVIADIGGHKTNYPGSILVQPNQCLTAVVETWCTSDTTACGNTATSSARSFTQIILPFNYSIQ